MSPEELRRKLEFYQDLGVKDLYRRAAARSVPIQTAAEPKPHPPVNIASVELPGMAPAGDTLDGILADIGECTRCRLHQGRNKLVFGVGNSQAKLVFVGEGPGADEDAQGVPFVGRAGQLLTQMIENTAAKEGIPLKRPDVYICNVVKCRPPENRTPLPEEIMACWPYLEEQLSLISPKVIVALGSPAAKTLLKTTQGIMALRGRWQLYKGIRVMPTYHPAFVLRQYTEKVRGEVWGDMQLVMNYLKETGA